MTLEELLSLARYGAALDISINFAEFEDIRNFEKTWRELVSVDLEDLDLRKRAEL